MFSESKAAIKEAVRKAHGLNPKLSQSATLDQLGKRLYGWQKAFAMCNQRQAFEQLDDYVIKQVVDYQACVTRFLGTAAPAVQMMVFGIPSTGEMFDKENP